MKNLKFIFFVGVVAIGLVGCAQTQTTPVAENETTPVVQITTTSLKDKIENLANYSVVTNKDEKSVIVSVCDDFTKAYADKVMNGDVKRLVLYEAENNLWSRLEVYSVPSYGLTEKDFEKVSACGELGSKTALKLISGNILWGYAYCSAGAIPTSDENGYAEYQDCTVVEKQLADYLK
ncbi:MAG: hypothetical protein WC651_03025 [Candidatus Gracilibacteria bacterium]|jgi:hypothetical protein